MMRHARASCASMQQRAELQQAGRDLEAALEAPDPEPAADVTAGILVPETESLEDINLFDDSGSETEASYATASAEAPQEPAADIIAGISVSETELPGNIKLSDDSDSETEASYAMTSAEVSQEPAADNTAGISVSETEPLEDINLSEDSDSDTETSYAMTSAGVPELKKTELESVAQDLYLSDSSDSN